MRVCTTVMTVLALLAPLAAPAAVPAAEAEAPDRRSFMTADVQKETAPAGQIAMGQPLIELKDIYKIYYLGGEEATMAINFSRSASHRLHSASSSRSVSIWAVSLPAVG